MANRNEFTEEELKTIIETMQAFPKHATSLTIELRPGQAGGKIQKNREGELTFTATQYQAPQTYRD